MSLRVAHVYKDSFPPVFGGIEQHIELLSRLQARAGLDVSVIAAGGGRVRSRTSERDGVRVLRLPELGRAASSPLTFAYPGALRRLDSDIVHFHHPNPIGELAEPFVRRGARRVLTYHADITRQRILGALYRPTLHRFVSRMDAVLVSSPALARSSPVLARHQERLHVVPFGVEGGPGPAQSRDRHRLLFVGRLREYKGVPVLLRAVAAVPDARLRIVGRGPMQGEIERLVSQLGLSGRVELLGDLPAARLDEEYRRARALVLPSIHRSEAFGIVLCEALARGTPLVTTELGTGTSWINQDGVCGRVVEPADEGALASAIREMIGDDGAWQRFHAGALRRALDFTPERMLEETLAVYESVR